MKLNHKIAQNIKYDAFTTRDGRAKTQEQRNGKKERTHNLAEDQGKRGRGVTTGEGNEKLEDKHVGGR